MIIVDVSEECFEISKILVYYIDVHSKQDVLELGLVDSMRNRIIRFTFS